MIKLAKLFGHQPVIKFNYKNVYISLSSDFMISNISVCSVDDTPNESRCSIVFTTYITAVAAGICDAQQQILTSI